MAYPLRPTVRLYEDAAPLLTVAPLTVITAPVSAEAVGVMLIADTVLSTVAK